MLEARSYRPARESRIVFLPRETLFLRGCDDAPVDDDRRGAIVVVSRDSQDAHSSLEQRVDERSDHRSLRENEQTADKNHGDDNRHEPKLFSDRKEPP